MALLEINGQRIDADRLQRVSEALRSDIKSNYIHGAAMQVSCRGKVIIDLVEGYADKSARHLLKRDSVYVTMSAGKPFTAVLALNLVERGLLRLHAPVADVIPEFGQFGKESVNLYHLMTHTSGLPGGVPALEQRVLSNIDKLTAYACSLALESQPGERVSYSMAVAHSVIAAMCLRVDGRGRKYATMLADDIFGPLGMTETSLGPRDDLLPRLCPLIGVQDVSYNLMPSAAVEYLGQVVLAPGSEFPAGGFLTTINDIHRFTEMLRRGGEFNGRRILSPAMLSFCAQNFTGNMRNSTWDSSLSARHWQPFLANIGIGFRVRGEGINPGPFGLLNSSGTFGHFGAGSTGIWVDPKAEISYSLLTTGLLEESHNLERTAMLSDLVISALVP